MTFLIIVSIIACISIGAAFISIFEDQPDDSDVDIGEQKDGRYNKITQTTFIFASHEPQVDVVYLYPKQPIRRRSRLSHIYQYRTDITKQDIHDWIDNVHMFDQLSHRMRGNRS